MPVPFYIGITAHLGIAAYYLAAHAGDVVFTNFTSIASILQQIGGVAGQPAPTTPVYGPPSPTQLAGKPDIANLTRHHLYEIKPRGSEALAASEAEWYITAFAMNGMAMVLGPSAEPGVNGFFYDAGWYFIFESPMPGVIIYYRSSRQPEPERVTEPEGVRVRFRVPQLTPEQQRQMAQNTVTVGTIGLIMLMILLLPVGA